MTTLSIVMIVVFALLAAGIVAGPRLWRLFGPRVGRFAGSAYQKNMLNQLKKKYPTLAERMEGLDLGPESQESFQNQVKRLPPQKTMELQAEFNRLREHFMERHPELRPLLEATSQDPKTQVKAFNQLLGFPADQRATIEKDLIWAWDQLRGRFPALMGPLENALKKKVEPAAVK